MNQGLKWLLNQQSQRRLRQQKLINQKRSREKLLKGIIQKYVEN